MSRLGSKKKMFLMNSGSGVTPPTLPLISWDDFTLTRNTIATYIDEYGIMQTASVNEKRFDYSLGIGEKLLLESASDNYFLNSDVLTNQTVLGTGNLYGRNNSLISFIGTGTLSWVVDGESYSLVGTGNSENDRVYMQLKKGYYDMNFTANGSVLKAMFEKRGDGLLMPSSYISTSSTYATRSRDYLVNDNFNTITDEFTLYLNSYNKGYGFSSDYLMQITASNSDFIRVFYEYGFISFIYRANGVTSSSIRIMPNEQPSTHNLKIAIVKNSSGVNLFFNGQKHSTVIENFSTNLITTLSSSFSSSTARGVSTYLDNYKFTDSSISDDEAIILTTL